MKNKNRNRNKAVLQGFTLVELAIVLVIIGFLIAAISFGSTLTKQVQLRSVINDFNQYYTAYTNFKDKYGAPPGDFNAAYAIWSSNCATSQAACNGTGNQILSSSNEEIKAWKHLQLAGMINANIAILDSSITTMTIGYNIPGSKILKAGYAYYGNLSPFTSIDNEIWIGSVSGGALIGNALSPEDSWIIDQKMDDGGTDSSGNFIGGVTGNVRARTGSGGNCLNGSNYYNITLTGPQCRLAMKVN